MTFTRPAAKINFTRDEDGFWNGTVEPWGEVAYVLDNIPATGSAYSVLWGAGLPWSAATLRSVSFGENPNATKGILVLSYSTAPAESGGEGNPQRDAADNTPIYSIRESGLQLPIEEHPDYRIIWNHHLVSRKVSESSYTTALAGFAGKTTTAMTATEEEDNKWIHYSDSFESPDGENNRWGIPAAQVALKPGVDYFIVSGPQVVERRWFKTRNAAVSWLNGNIRGTKKTPGDTFGKVGGEWLIFDSSLSPDGKRWQGEVIYQWADEWDSDLYGV